LEDIRTIAMLGNHTPRQCGIATFTADLATALSETSAEIDCLVLAMNDHGASHSYPPRVRFEIEESDPASYRRAADFLNVNDVEVASVQHEYGIFGGKAGSHLLPLLRDLRMPIVTTLHTVVKEPTSVQRAAMDEITRLSERLVVMSAHGADLLQDVHGVPREKIDLIPHGIPETPAVACSKPQLGVEGRNVLLTFGLLSPDKGIEYVIDALPEIVAAHPETVYVVLGATHPHVRQREGEAYRLMLELRAQKLGVDANVIFHDRFVSQRELSDFLSAADIYVTPYLNPAQITSGTLAYAVGAGKAVISTPYLYASELLAERRGILVPWRDPGAIAKEVVGLLGDDEERRALGARAAAHGRQMRWPAVASRYMESFARARADHSERRRTVFHARTLAGRPTALPEVKLDHIRQMTDGTGILQHAIYGVPRYEDGYCIDDNARALLLMALIEDAGTSEAATVRALATRYIAFVSHAFNQPRGRFRNFMSYSREWLEDCGSEDSHGRTLWALGTVVGRSEGPGKQSLAGRLFQEALPAVGRFTSPRAWAFTLLGIDEYLRAFQGDSNVQAIGADLSQRLLELHRKTSDDSWPWFENVLAYSNARLCQALLVSGTWLANEEMVSTGLRSLRWLVGLQISESGDFEPVGSDGFYPRGGAKARFDQQPIEAGAMVAGCLAAARITSDPAWERDARCAFAWFLGRNHLQQAVYDPVTGGCRDGIHADRLNQNQGAESTLAFLLALCEMRAASPAAPAGVTRS
jgi:glycosyltransferase involved in cell wall biosynthesis